MAYITDTVDEELLLRREYLSAENRILVQQLQGRLRLGDPQRQTLAEIGHRLGRKALGDVANIVRPGGFDLGIGSGGFFDQTRLCRHEARRNPANRVLLGRCSRSLI